MLFKLSFKNIKKSYKDYAIYFLTLILGVAIFYVFNAIGSQTAMMGLSKSTIKMVELMNELLSSVSVFVSIILGFLIIYASIFLIKRRNKEFGIYLTLGMSKRKISIILFFETLLIGIISLIVGLILGVFASQLMSIVVANMFEADMTSFKFTFSQSACIKSMIYFGIMYFLVIIFNTFSVSKCKLIDLLYSKKKNEKIKIKNPILCVIVFIISCVMLGYAYSLITGGVETFQEASALVKPIILGSLSTFLIFWSLSGFILKIVISIKNLYYKDLNSFILRQISSKINTAVFSVSIICLMLFITLGVLTAAISMKDSLNDNINTYAPIDYQIAKLYKADNDLSKKSIKEIYAGENINLDLYTKNSISFDTYRINNLTFKTTLGSFYYDISKNYIYLDYDAFEDVMRVSDYNKVAKLFGKERLLLKDNEYIIIANMDAYVEMRNKSLQLGTKINVNGNMLVPKFNETKSGSVELASQKINLGIIIVPDNVLKGDQKYKEYYMGNYKANSKEEKSVVEETLFNTKTLNKMGLYDILFYNTKLDIAEASAGLGAIVTFIGLYIGIIFLISSSAVLALKELSESSDNKERLMILRKIGTDEKMLNNALFRQIGIFFLFPLVLAIIHSVFGMKFISNILSVMGIDLVSKSTIFTYMFLLVIYGAYFLITYFCSKSIIKEKR